jgi:hypothetical protein
MFAGGDFRASAVDLFRTGVLLADGVAGALAMSRTADLGRSKMALAI